MIHTERRKRVMQRSIKLGHCVCDPKKPCPCDIFKGKNICLCAGERLESPTGPVQLTKMIEKAGCASKIDQAFLKEVLGELGFVTNAADRELMLSQPEYYAGIILRGLEQHFYTRGRSDAASLVPLEFDSITAGEEGAIVRLNPYPSSRAIHRFEAGDLIRPVDSDDGWYEVLLRNPFRTGWVSENEIAMRSAPVSFVEN